MAEPEPTGHSEQPEAKVGTYERADRRPERAPAPKTLADQKIEAELTAIANAYVIIPETD